LNSLTLEQGPDSVFRTYLGNSSGVDDRGLPDNRLGQPESQSSLSATQVDRSLATPSSIEWTAGMQREMAPEVSVSLRYIHKDYHDQLQDIDVNHRLEIDPFTGRPADRLGTVDCDKKVGCVNSPNGAL